MTQVYSVPSREEDKYSLPDVEVFYINRPRGFEGLAYIGEMIVDESMVEYSLDEGWYYWYCLPGCLPDGDPIGPFDTEQLAIDDAQEDSWQFEDDDTDDEDMVEVETE